MRNMVDPETNPASMLVVVSLSGKWEVDVHLGGRAQQVVELKAPQPRYKAEVVPLRRAA